jgi:hypothetical protein
VAVVLVEAGVQGAKTDVEPESESEAESDPEEGWEPFEPVEPDALVEPVVPLEPVPPVLPVPLVEFLAPACPASVAVPPVVVDEESDAADEDPVAAPSSRAPSVLLHAVRVRVTAVSAAAASRRVRAVRADM